MNGKIAIAVGIALQTIAGLALIYCLTGAAVYLGMRLPPEQFARLAAAGPTLWMWRAFPVERMWKIARAGRLRPGDPAPDFELSTPDRSRTVRLSDHRGDRPVLLVFGSYT